MRFMKRRRWIVGLAAMSFVVYLLRQWGTRWGATLAEYHQVLPGDEVVMQPDLEITNAITVQTSAAQVWPWLVQLGYYRGGWFTDSTWRDWDYYPDRVLRFFVREEVKNTGYQHRDEPSAAQLMAEFQGLKTGDTVLDGPPGTAYFTVAAIQPNQALILYSNTHLRYLFPKSIREYEKFGIGGEFTWGFILQEAEENQTRLLLRTRGTVDPGWYRIFVQIVIPIANLFLAKKMLGGIKERAEQSQ